MSEGKRLATGNPDTKRNQRSTISLPFVSRAVSGSDKRQSLSFSFSRGKRKGPKEKVRGPRKNAAKISLRSLRCRNSLIPAKKHAPGFAQTHRQRGRSLSWILSRIFSKALGCVTQDNLPSRVAAPALKIFLQLFPLPLRRGWRVASGEGATGEGIALLLLMTSRARLCVEQPRAVCETVCAWIPSRAVSG
jgi:hypothetical protein